MKRPPLTGQSVNFSGNRSDCRLSYVRKYGTVSGNVSSAAGTSRLGISCCLVTPVYADGNCLIPYLSEKSKSGSVETVPDPACSELFLAGFLF